MNIVPYIRACFLSSTCQWISIIFVIPFVKTDNLPIDTLNTRRLIAPQIDAQKDIRAFYCARQHITVKHNAINPSQKNTTKIGGEESVKVSKLGGKHVNIDLEPFPSTIVMDDIVLPGTPSPACFCLCCNTQTGSLDNNFDIDCPYSTKSSQSGLNH